MRGVIACLARRSDTPRVLVCDLPDGHPGRRHRERCVAAWTDYNGDVRWFNEDTEMYDLVEMPAAFVRAGAAGGETP